MFTYIYVRMQYMAIIRPMSSTVEATLIFMITTIILRQANIKLR